MTFTESVKCGFSIYVTFSGRASRSEYWWWFLFNILVAIGAGILDAAFFGTSAAQTTGPLGALTTLALFLPSIAVFIRRLHDRDKSGWWFLFLFVPLIGFIVLMIWMIMPGTDGPNRFGVEPA
ncbi:MAG: DUF805 domain-containing protein [Pseudobdellovibrionaceae bacterium]